MENGKSVGTVGQIIGEALRPPLSRESAMSKRTILDELHARLRETWAERRELEARQHEIQEQIARIHDDATEAEWHRLAVIAARENTPEAIDAAHKAWVHDMAVHMLKRGTRPDMGSHCQSEIDEEIDRLAGTVQ
jgi:hypothetical protein